MNVFNIKDFGARTCDALQTVPIQSAIDACFLQGGGRVVIPCGVYITGSIRLRSNVELYLETGAIVKGVRDPEEYFGYRDDKIEPLADLIKEEAASGKTKSGIATSRWSNALIRAIHAKNIAITG